MRRLVLYQKNFPFYVSVILPFCSFYGNGYFTTNMNLLYVKEQQLMPLYALIKLTKKLWQMLLMQFWSFIVATNSFPCFKYVARFI